MDDLGFVPVEASPQAPANVSFPDLEVLPQRAPATVDDLGFKPIEAPAPAPAQAAAADDLGFQPVEGPAKETELEEKYGTDYQMAVGLAEKFAKGLIPAPAVSAFERAIGVSPEEMKGREEYLGTAGTAAEMAGFAAGMFLPFGYAKLLGKVGAAAVRGVGLAEKAGEAAKFATLGEKVARGVVSQVPEMAAFGALNELDKYIMNKPQTASSVMADIGLNAVLGGAFGAAMPLIGEGIKTTAGPALEGAKNALFRRTRALDDGHVVSPIMRKMLRWYGGVPEEVIDSYIAERQKVLAMPEFTEIHEAMGESLTKTYENLAEKKINTAQAKGEFKAAVTNAVKELKAKIKDTGVSIDAAEEMLQEQVLRIQKELEHEVVENISPDIYRAKERLQTSRNTLSAGARKILDETPGATDLKPFLARLDEMIQERIAATDMDAARPLQDYRKTLVKLYGDALPYNKSKDVIQTLQGKAKYNKFQTEKLNAPTRFFQELAGILNDQVKAEVPAYAAEMVPTAEAAALLKALDPIKEISDVQKIALSLKSPKTYAKWMPMLEQLEQQTGMNFTEQLKKYISPEYLKTLEEALPQKAKLNKLLQLEESLKDPATLEAIQKSMKLGEEARALKTAQTMQQMAEEKVEALGRITPQNIESVMKKAMAGNETAIQRLRNIGVVAIPNVGLMSLPEVLRLIKVRESFEKGAVNGSRNVQLFSRLGKGLGTIVGGTLGAVGLPEHGWFGALGAAAVGEKIGALIGGAADYEGPAWVKWYLDKKLDKAGDIAKIIGTRDPEDLKTAFIQVIGKDKEWTKRIDAYSLKSTTEFIQKQKKGQKLIKDGSKYILLPGKVLPKEFLPDPDKAKETEEKAKELEGKPQKITELTRGLESMPEYSAQLMLDVGRLVTMINKYKPQPVPGAFFDKPIEPNAEEKRLYQTGLEFAENPLSIYSKIKSNTLTPRQVEMFQALHPEIYGQMKKDLMESMIEHGAEGKKIPFQLRQTLSLFMGMELDSGVAPRNIMAAQNAHAARKAQMQNMMGAASASKTKALAKTANNYETPEQARESRQRQG